MLKYLLTLDLILLDMHDKISWITNESIERSYTASKLIKEGNYIVKQTTSISQERRKREVK